MDPLEVCRLAARVREAQRAYFADRNRTNLNRAKRLEAELDAALAGLGLGAPPAALAAGGDLPGQQRLWD
jgi:hypothetical protein